MVLNDKTGLIQLNVFGENFAMYNIQIGNVICISGFTHEYNNAIQIKVYLANPLCYLRKIVDCHEYLLLSLLPGIVTHQAGLLHNNMPEFTNILKHIKPSNMEEAYKLVC